MIISKLSMLIPLRCTRDSFYPGNRDHPELLQFVPVAIMLHSFSVRIAGGLTSYRWAYIAFIEKAKPHVFGPQFVGARARKYVSPLDPGTLNFGRAVFLHLSYSLSTPNQCDRRIDRLPYALLDGFTLCWYFLRDCIMD